MSNTEMVTMTIDNSFGGSSHLDYTAAPVEELDKNIYSVAQISVDMSSSVSPFVKDLQTALQKALLGIEDKSVSEGKKGIPMLIRTATFQHSFYNGGSLYPELHGYKQVGDLAPDDVKLGNPQGGTPLFDCMMRDLDIQKHFTDKMAEEVIQASALFIWITDGEDTASNATKEDVKKKLRELKASEDLDFVMTLLIGINDNNPTFESYLKSVKDECELDHFVKFEDLDSLPKLITAVSQSVSSNTGSGQAPDLSGIIADTDL